MGNGHGEIAKLLLSYAYPTPKDLSGGFSNVWPAFVQAVKAGHLSVLRAFLAALNLLKSFLTPTGPGHFIRQADVLEYHEVAELLLKHAPPSTNWAKSNHWLLV